MNVAGQVVPIFAGLILVCPRNRVCPSLEFDQPVRPIDPLLGTGYPATIDWTSLPRSFSGPDGLALKSQFQIDLSVVKQQTKLVDGVLAEDGWDRHAKNVSKKPARSRLIAQDRTRTCTPCGTTTSK